MTLMACPWPISRLLPHQHPMILLDEVLGYNQTKVVATVAIHGDHPFLRDGRVPAHVGIELMAQACGAYSGAHSVSVGSPVRIGFLLGTRDFMARTDGFARDDRLVVVAEVTFADDEMGVFDCRIEQDGEVMVSARLNVFQPKDQAATIASLKGEHG